MRLTDITIKALKSRPPRAYVLYDDTLPGFGIRVSQAGTKSFVLTHGVRRRRETIGRVGIISLSEARQEAKRRCAEYTLGKHRPKSMSWNAAREEFLRIKRESLKANTVAGYRMHLAYFPFGETKLPDIGEAELQRDLAKVKKPGQRHNTFVCLRTFFRWAYKKHYIDRNPVERMEPTRVGAPRKRVLDDQELPTVLKAALEGDTPFHAIVALLALTGQRRSEIGGLRWAWIDLDQKLITVPGEFVKNGEDHTFPVGDLTVRVLRERPRGLYVFPALERFENTTTFNGWSKAKAELDEEVGLPHWTLHDLRRTLRTNWAELGVLEEVAEKYINHISGKHSGLGRTYNRAKYIQPMRDAVSLWESHLQKLLKT